MIVLAALATKTAVEWGAVGALFTLLVVQIFPAGAALWRGASLPNFTWPRLLGAVIIVAVFLAAGAVASVQGKPTDATDAFFYGMTCQTVMAGLTVAVANH